MKVYLAGGINGLSDTDCRDWRERAKELLNAETLDPMRRDYRGQEAENALEIVTGDLADIDDCEIVLVNAIRPSWGTAMEIFYAAHVKEKQVVGFVPDIEKASPWLSNFAFLTDSLEAACRLINGLNLLAQNNAK
jgi:nucleoside 2-deoxyribosyltransferase